MDKLSPIVIFTYRRVPDKLINSLLKNNLAHLSEVIIYSDGNKNEKDLEDVCNVRKYLQTIVGFKNIKIIESEVNKGLANSIIDGVSEVIDKFEKVIVLEDDLIVSDDFLEYMNDALKFYKDNKNIWSISGYGPNLPCLKDFNDDVYLSVRVSPWGWSTWKDRWTKIDWEVKDYQKIKQNRNLRDKFNLAGNDMFKMLELQMLGKIDSWAIRWYYNQFILGMHTVYPVRSKIINDGFNDDKGTHVSGSSSKWTVELNHKKINFKNLSLRKEIIECFRNYHNLSLVTRIGYFLKKNGGYKIFKRIYNYLRKGI